MVIEFRFGLPQIERRDGEESEGTVAEFYPFATRDPKSPESLCILRKIIFIYLVFFFKKLVNISFPIFCF